MHVFLAHGALGPYDELIMLGAATIFLVMMGISWVKSRNSRPDFEKRDETVEVSTNEAQVEDVKQDAPDRFRLD